MLSISELSISEFQVPISNTFEVSLPAVPQAFSFQVVSFKLSSPKCNFLAVIPHTVITMAVRLPAGIP